jgi:UDP-N-acetylglucosamine 4-epimerase
MTLKTALLKILPTQKQTWLITGAAGFIGSHIAQALLESGQNVNALDNYITGKKENIDFLTNIKTSGKFTFFEADICNLEQILPAFNDVNYVIHQAALGSVPRSIDFPIDSHASNVTGFLNVLEASKINSIKRVVYASSSSVYGDSQELPKFEDRVGKVLSPYAATKMCNEIYADSYASCYQMELVGLRYFNVFGARQDPEGPYAAVIPRWIEAIKKKEQCKIYGDGNTSRDFCYIDNVVYANILSAINSKINKSSHEVFNIACGSKTTLSELYLLIAQNVKKLGLIEEVLDAEYLPFRSGDIVHSLANIDKSYECISYRPLVLINEGIENTVKAYFNR